MTKNEPVWERKKREIMLELAELAERKRVLRRHLRALVGTIDLARGIDAANEPLPPPVEASPPEGKE